MDGGGEQNGSAREWANARWTAGLHRCSSGGPLGQRKKNLLKLINQ